MIKNKSLGFKRALLCSVLMAGGTAAAQAAATATVPGNVAGWVASAPLVGPADTSKFTRIAVHMALPHLDDLKKVVADVSRPGSARYGRYLSSGEIKARFAPSADDVAAVQALLTGAGMRDVTVGPLGTYVSAVATVRQLQTTFGVSQNLYRHGLATLRANKELPTIPASLAGKVVYIEGLDQTDLLRTPQHHSATAGPLVAPDSAGATPDFTPPPVAAALPSPYCDTYVGDLEATLSTKPGPYNKALPWLNCGYTPAQIQQAYGMNRTKLDGTGVRVAILDAYASPTLKADGNRYATNHNLPLFTAKNFSQIIPKGIYSLKEADTLECGGEYGWWTEQSLDIAAVHGSAPGASILYVGAADCGTSLSLALVDVIANEQADVITNSYGFNGEAGSAADIAMLDQAFMMADAEGITVLFSSGDDGDLSQVNGVASGSFSATSPYVTGVGGTSLALLDATGRKKEFGWGTYRDFLAGATVNSGTSVTTSGLTTTSFDGIPYDAFTYYAGSGGGISFIEPQPAYQASVVPAALSTYINEAIGYSVPLPNPMRVSPDVAMDADPYTGYLYGESFTIAGNPISDHNCTPTSNGQEYCEDTEGGTSLASPLMAGVIAIMDQARMVAGKPVVGFVNPLFYGSSIGATYQSSGINDVKPPTHPFAFLRGYANNLNEVRVVTVNSAPFVVQPTPFPLLPCNLPKGVCEGLNDVFNDTTSGYDDVTGLGVPWIPELIKD